MLSAIEISAADSSVADDVPDEMLLPDNLGRTLKVPVESVPLGLRPTSRLGLKYQTPATHKGVSPGGCNPRRIKRKMSSFPMLPRHAKPLESINIERAIRAIK